MQRKSLISDETLTSISRDKWKKDRLTGARWFWHELGGTIPVLLQRTGDIHLGISLMGIFHWGKASKVLSQDVIRSVTNSRYEKTNDNE